MKKSQLFSLSPNPLTGEIPQNSSLAAGLGDLAFCAKSLILSASDGQLPRDINQAIPGGMTFEVVGVTSAGGVWYRRRFDVSAYRSVVVPVGAFKNAQVFVIRSTLAGFTAQCVASEEEFSYHGEPVYLGTVAIVAGEYPVPDGASEAFFGGNDAGFLWRANTGAGFGFPSIDVAVPAVAGQRQPVAGSRYVVSSVTPLPIIWRIEL